ncbi:hypothetical protein GF373_17615 [bacterium]|nr:hypothetical protein [bacterium]
MSKFGLKETLRQTKKAYMIERTTGILEPDRRVYEELARLFQMNGYAVGYPPARSSIARGEDEAFTFRLNLCSEEKEDLTWINDYFPGQVQAFVIPPPAKNPLDGGLLFFHWSVKNLRAGIVADDLLDYVEDTRSRRVLTQVVRATIPYDSGRTYGAPDNAPEVRRTIMQEINSLCAKWPQASNAAKYIHHPDEGKEQEVLAHGY